MRHLLVIVASIAVLGAFAPASRAQTAPDPVGLQIVSAGHGKARLTVTAGASGAPYGFQILWMSTDQFASLGGLWPAPGTPGEGWDAYTGLGTLNTWGASAVSFQLAPYQPLDIEIGDTFDESGVSGTTHIELLGGTGYVFCAYAIGPGGGSNSALTGTLQEFTTQQGSNCTYTQGFWKNHASDWPVTSLTLGTVSYTATQLMSILNQSVAGNGLVSLAHQLIAAKLNVAMGADATSIAGTISSADAAIGSLVVPPIGSGFLPPGVTDPLTQVLDDYNNGETGPGHCGTTLARPSTWGAVKSRYR